ncbi:tetratricopeptide repeat protein [Trinickia violacea]|uniref:protein O-GlcNAc transferase n=1 Tax=Trinickia violacea TaxID=2571746 RepID=A0A4P8IZ30_9BURK|nr:tetratricopeptide repeat protein [Trinickia violacea]QCP53726.1 tetratricopeptide repeat protein [Trinickia violacea]
MSVDEPVNARFEAAKARHLAGDLAAAGVLYREVLAAEPNHHEAMFRTGILEWQSGRGGDALSWLDRAIEQQPDAVRYRFGKGQIFAALGRYDDAAAVYHSVLAQQPESVDAWFALGSMLQAKGEWPGAIDAYSAVLAREPQHLDALNNLGNCHRLRGELDAAEDAYRRALALRPDYASALANLATLIQARGRIDDAIALLREAVAAELGVAAHLVNLGVALGERRRFAEAAEALERALAIDARVPEAAYNLANILQALGRHREAAVQYGAAIALRADHADAYNNLGNVCQALGEYAAAAEAFDAAIRIRPSFVAAWNNAGNLARTLGHMDEAEARYRKALAVDAAHAVSHNNLGNVLKDTGALDEAVDCYRRALAHDPANVIAHSNLAYALTFQSEDGYAIRDECLRFAERHEAPYRVAGAARAALPAYANERAPSRRLRIGYVSADFRDHCQTLFTTPLFSHHDHAGFEIFCYSTVAQPDEYTRRLAAHADVWRDVGDLDDAPLAQRIRDDRIDILVDLTMHMANGRPLLFARRPAPVQAAWLAYPGTTGSGAIGYRLTDPWLDPQDAPNVDDQYSERSIRLPDSFWCYDPLTDALDVNPLPALETGRITFGCLNNTCKLTDHTLRLWAGVLALVRDARLVLMAAPGKARERLSARLAAHGIAPERVGFFAFRPRAAYLETYHEIDLALDTFPYNGHTTSLDAFWMGVPVVTRVGRTAVGRGGLSQLANLGLPELAAHSDDEYVRIAVQWANDRPRLASLRAGLRARMERSALMDGESFARGVEGAYRRMWGEWCAQPAVSDPSTGPSASMSGAIDATSGRS